MWSETRFWSSDLFRMARKFFCFFTLPSFAVLSFPTFECADLCIWRWLACSRLNCGCGVRWWFFKRYKYWLCSSEQAGRAGQGSSCIYAVLSAARCNCLAYKDSFLFDIRNFGRWKGMISAHSSGTCRQQLSRTAEERFVIWSVNC